MDYTKQPLTFEQQADLLISRGLQADRDFLITHLKSVYYYRITTYLHPFKMRDEKFKPGTTFEIVWRRYTFDRRLRVLLMDAIERIEIAVRTQVGYHFSHAKGPFGYTDSVNLPKLSQEEHGELMDRFLRDRQISCCPLSPIPFECQIIFLFTPIVSTPGEYSICVMRI